jgi:MFS family permease
MYATFAFLPEFVQTPSAAGYGFGASITRSGLMLLPSSFTMFAVGMFAGRLARRLGGKALVVAGCLIGSAAMAILAFAHQQVWEIYLSNAVMGIGFGLAFSAMSALVVAAVPAGQTGVASGMNANIRTIGGSIGSAVMASIVTSRLLPSGLPTQAGYTVGFAVMTGMLVLSALAGLLIPTIRRQAPSGEPEQAGEVVTPAGYQAGAAGRSEGD